MKIYIIVPFEPLESRKRGYSETSKKRKKTNKRVKDKRRGRDGCDSRQQWHPEIKERREGTIKLKRIVIKKKNTSLIKESSDPTHYYLLY